MSSLHNLKQPVKNFILRLTGTDTYHYLHKKQVLINIKVIEEFNAQKLTPQFKEKSG